MRRRANTQANAAKSNVSSPTISTEAVFLFLTIAAKENQDLIRLDFPGAFLQTPLKDERVHICFVGRMAELLVMVYPKLYCPHIAVEIGRLVLYVEHK